MSSKFYTLHTILLVTILLSGCEKAKQALGRTKEGPDEFSVFQRAPLSLPPDYNLRPPKPGSKRPQTVESRDRAIQALGIKRNSARMTNKAHNLSGLSRGELAVLQLTGATKADPSIRRRIREEARILAEESKSFTDKIAFWQNSAKFGVTVNPALEAKRIRENQALGKPLNKGDIPIIKRRQKPIFEEVFD